MPVIFTVIFLIILIFLNRKWDFGSDFIIGKQKFHNNTIPRTGGIGIFLSIFLSLFLENTNLFYILIYPSLILFLSALYEDLNSNLSPILRLIFILLSSLVLVIYSDISLKQFDFFLFDQLLKIPLINIIFTTLTISLVINSFNIIDGFNGLVSGFSLIVLGSMIYLSHNIESVELTNHTDIIFLSIFGFFLLNFPFGKIFLGDAGAYLIGFLVTFILIDFTSQNDIVSIWFALSVLMYPIFEVVFSIVRKKFFFNSSAFKPDGYHLHMLIHRNLVSCAKLPRDEFCNSATSIFLWALSLITILPSMFWYDNSLILFLISVFFMLIYINIYVVLYKLDKKK